MGPVFAEPLQIGAKAAVFVGVVLLLGAGAFAAWVVRPPLPGSTRGRLTRGAILGVLLLSGGSLVEIAGAIARSAGAFDASLIVPYLLETRHGNAVIARLVLAAPLVLAGGSRSHARLEGRVIFSVLAVAMLLTLTLVSHAGAQGRALPILADLVHVAGVAFWAGSVVYAASVLAWPPAGAAAGALQASMRRLSTLGLGGLTLIVATGVYAAVVRLPDLEAVVRTPYGRALLIKAAVVSLVIAAAAVNRWVGIPWTTRGLTPIVLRRLVRAEALLILVVLALTGLLVSQPLPEPPATVAGTVTFSGTAGPWVLRGAVTGRGVQGFSIELRVQDARGAPAPETLTVGLEATMLDMVMAPLADRLPRVGPGLYRGTFQLPMAGQWQLAIRTAAGAVTIRIPTQEARAAPPQVRWSVAVPGLLAVLVGVGLAVTGLRRLGAGSGPAAWPIVVGLLLLAAGAAAAIRAVGS